MTTKTSEKCEHELRLENELLKQRIAKLERAIWNNMVDADFGGDEGELSELFCRIWLPDSERDGWGERDRCLT